MDLVRVTEAAAMAASRWMGRGEKLGADGAAVEAMRTVLSSVPMDGLVVIGEGEKDNAPMLFNGKKTGDGTPPLTHIAVDPIDDTTLTAQGRGGALAVIAVAERGAMFDPDPASTWRSSPGGRGPRAPATSGVRRPRTSTPSQRPWAVPSAIDGRDPRPAPPRRPAAGVRATGARIRLISDGDVAGAIATGWPGAGTDILLWHRGHARGCHCRGRLEVHGRRDPGEALPAQRAGAGRRGRGRRTCSTPC